MWKCGERVSFNWRKENGRTQSWWARILAFKARADRMKNQMLIMSLGDFTAFNIGVGVPKGNHLVYSGCFSRLFPCACLIWIIHTNDLWMLCSTLSVLFVQIHMSRFFFKLIRQRMGFFPRNVMEINMHKQVQMFHFLQWWLRVYPFSKMHCFVGF